MARIPTAENIGKVDPIGVNRVPNIPVNAFGQENSRLLQQSAQTAARAVGKFRQARAASQLSGATTQAAIALKEAEREFEQDSGFDTVEQRYQERAEEIRAKALEGITDDAVRVAFEAEFDRSRAIIGINVRWRARLRFVEQAQASLLEDTARFVELYARAETRNERDDALEKGLAAITDAEEVGTISPENAAERRRAFRSSAAERLTLHLIVEEPELAEQELADPAEPFADLAEQTRLALLDQAQKRAAGLRRDRERARERALAEQEAALAAEKAAKSADLKIRVGRGEAGFAEVEAAAAQGIIGQDKRVELARQIDEAHEARKKETELVKFVSDAITDGKVFLDPKSADHRKGVDLYFERIIAPELAKRAEDWKIDAIVQFVGKAGMFPTAVKGQIRGALNGQSPLGKVAAAAILERMRLEVPGAVDRSFSGRDMAHGLHIASLIDGGMTPDDALRLADEARLRSPAEKEALRERAKLERHEARNRSFVEDELDSAAFGGGPSIPDEFIADFNELQSAFFAETGDLEASQKAALTRLKSLWSGKS